MAFSHLFPFKAVLRFPYKAFRRKEQMRKHYVSGSRDTHRGPCKEKHIF